MMLGHSGGLLSSFFYFSPLLNMIFWIDSLFFSPLLIISNGLVHPLSWKDVEMQTLFFKLELAMSIAQCVTLLKTLHLYRPHFQTQTSSSQLRGRTQPKFSLAGHPGVSRRGMGVYLQIDTVQMNSLLVCEILRNKDVSVE